MAEKTVSIRDVARMAGVSTATVSKVLNGKGSISKATRERVEEVARREGYVASLAARTLRDPHTRTVGIVTPDVSNDFFSSVILGVETALYDAGYASYVCNTQGSEGRERDYLASLAQRQTDGLAFVGGRRKVDWGLVPAGTPAVCVDQPFGERRDGVAYVSNDWPGIVRDATRTLLGRGCRHVAYLAVTGAHVTMEDNPFFDAYAATLASAGMPLDRNLVLQGSHRGPSMAEAAELVGRCLDDGWKLDGVVALGDRIALGALDALRERGVRVGRDVLVMGVDDSLYSRISNPALSSVDRRVDDLAREGATALLAMLSGDQPPSMDVIVPHDVIERESTLGTEGQQRVL